MPHGNPSENQVRVLEHVVLGRRVTDLGAGDCILATFLRALGATRVECVDRRLPRHVTIPRAFEAPTFSGNFFDQPEVSRVEQSFARYRPKESIDIAFLSWPSDFGDAGLAEVLETASTVIYLGSNTDSNACGSREVLEHFLTRDIVNLTPHRANTLLVLGARRNLERDGYRLPTGDEFAGLMRAGGGRIYSYEEAREHDAEYAKREDLSLRKTIHLHHAREEKPCPYCGLLIESASSEEERPPQPGDYMFCAGCGEPSILTDEYGYRRMTALDRAEAGLDNNEYLELRARFARQKGTVS